MSKYFIDTEFLEGTQMKRFLGMNVGNTNPTIDLISIGIVCEDGREYYAISKDFNLKEAWNRYDLKVSEETELSSPEDFILSFREETNSVLEWKKEHPKFKVLRTKGRNYKDYWIRENVIWPIYRELVDKEFESNLLAYYEYPFTYSSMKYLIKKYGKSNKQIAEEVYEFCSNNYHKGNNLSFQQRKEYELYDKFKPEFYGYYSDYDWVVFCWLFGKMIDLPKGFPMYCNDLKQTLDENAWSTYCNNGTLNSETSLEERLKYLKGESNTHLIEPNKPKYPKQTNEHNSLCDARWTKQLYEFLNKL